MSQVPRDIVLEAVREAQAGPVDRHERRRQRVALLGHPSDADRAKWRNSGIFSRTSSTMPSSERTSARPAGVEDRSRSSVTTNTCLSGVPYRHSAVRTGPQIRRDNPRVIGWREYVRARGFSRSGCLPHRIPRWTGTHQPVFSILRHAGHIRFEWPAGGVNFWRQRRHRFLGARRSSLSKNRSCLLMLPRTVRLDGRERV